MIREQLNESRKVSGRPLLTARHKEAGLSGLGGLGGQHNNDQNSDINAAVQRIRSQKQSTGFRQGDDSSYQLDTSKYSLADMQKSQFLDKILLEDQDAISKKERKESSNTGDLKDDRSSDLQLENQITLFRNPGNGKNKGKGDDGKRLHHFEQLGMAEFQKHLEKQKKHERQENRVKMLKAANNNPDLLAHAEGRLREYNRQNKRAEKIQRKQAQQSNSELSANEQDNSIDNAKSTKTDEQGTRRCPSAPLTKTLSIERK